MLNWGLRADFGVPEASMKFGFSIKPSMPEMPAKRIVSLTRQAEAAGFEYGWTLRR
jgi:hypothetical protein